MASTAAIKRRFQGWFSPDIGEDRLVGRFIVTSLAAHGFVLILNQLDLMPRVDFSEDEWEIRADLISDLDLSAPEKTELPNAKEAPEAAVPANMLPQLTKKFKVDEDTVADEGMTEEPEAKVAETPKKVEEKEKLNVKADPDEMNVLKKAEALRRLAMERLRKEKTAEELQAEKASALAKLRDDAALSRKPNSGGAEGSGLALQKYRSMVQAAVRRHYALPEAYNLRNAELSVVIAIVVNERGDLVSTKIEKPSGDSVFDELAFEAVKKSAPLPKPPADQAGEWIHLKFSPKSF